MKPNPHNVQEIHDAIEECDQAADALARASDKLQDSHSLIRKRKIEFREAVIDLIQVFAAESPTIAAMTEAQVQPLIDELEGVHPSDVRALIEAFHVAIAPLGFFVGAEKKLMLEATMPMLLNRDAMAINYPLTELELQIEEKKYYDLKSILAIEEVATLYPHTEAALNALQTSSREGCLVAKVILPDTDENTNDLAHWMFQRKADIDARLKPPSKTTLRSFEKEAQEWLDPSSKIFGFVYYRFNEEVRLNEKKQQVTNPIIEITYGPKEHPAFHGRGIVKALLDGIKKFLNGSSRKVHMTVPEKDTATLNMLVSAGAFVPREMIHNYDHKGNDAILMEFLGDLPTDHS